MNRIIFVILLCMSLPVVAFAQTTGEMELGPRYFDELHGFSLCPPAQTERKREFSASRLVSWLKRDSQTGAIVWTLSVLRATESDKNIDLQKYAQVLAENLRRNENFKIDSTEVAPVAGKAAITLKGVTGGPIKLWQRQTWILAEPGRFLIIMITGPVDAKADVDAICEKVLQTLKLTDPRQAEELRRESLKRGQELVGGLTDAKIEPLIKIQPQWFLLRFKGKDAGFMKQQEAIATRQGAKGIVVKTYAMIQLPDDQVRLVYRDMFATADRSVEMWTERLQIGSGKTAMTVGEKGVRQNDMVVCDVFNDAQTKSLKKPLAGGLLVVYLPRAMNVIIPRIIDISETREYSFASYVSQANSFDMHTYSFEGRHDIDTLGGTVKAIKVQEKPAADLEASTLWLDEQRNLLRLQTPDGLTMEACAKEAVLRRYSNANAIVNAMGK